MKYEYKQIHKTLTYFRTNYYVYEKCGYNVDGSAIERIGGQGTYPIKYEDITYTADKIEELCDTFILINLWYHTVETTESLHNFHQKGSWLESSFWYDKRIFGAIKLPNGTLQIVAEFTKENLDGVIL